MLIFSNIVVLIMAHPVMLMISSGKIGLMIFGSLFLIISISMNGILFAYMVSNIIIYIYIYIIITIIKIIIII